MTCLLLGAFESITHHSHNLLWNQYIYVITETYNLLEKKCIKPRLIFHRTENWTLLGLLIHHNKYTLNTTLMNKEHFALNIHCGIFSDKLCH